MKNELKGHKYTVNYDSRAGIVNCIGRFRLLKPEYKQISDLLHQAVEDGHDELTLNLRGLEFLNSSGIKTFYEFVIDVRNHNNIQLLIQGSASHKWQPLILENCRKLMPKLQLEIQ